MNFLVQNKPRPLKNVESLSCKVNWPWNDRNFIPPLVRRRSTYVIGHIFHTQIRCVTDRKWRIFFNKSSILQNKILFGFLPATHNPCTKNVCETHTWRIHILQRHTSRGLWLCFCFAMFTISAFAIFFIFHSFIQNGMFDRNRILLAVIVDYILVNTNDFVSSGPRSDCFIFSVC